MRTQTHAYETTNQSTCNQEHVYIYDRAEILAVRSRARRRSTRLPWWLFGMAILLFLSAGLMRCTATPPIEPRQVRTMYTTE